MKRWLLGLFAAVALMNIANAQVVFKGESKAKAGKMVLVSLDQADGDDLKIVGYRDGKLTKENWQIFKDLDNKYVIMCLPVRSEPGETDGDEGHTYTFVAALNKEKKTFLSSHELLIEGKAAPKPNVDPVVPVPPKPPVPATWRDKLSTAYSAAPNKEALNKYQSMWEELNKQKFKKYGDFELALQASAKKYLKDDEIRGVRDVVAGYLLETLKEDPRTMEMNKAQDAINEVIAALKLL